MPSTASSAFSAVSAAASLKLFPPGDLPGGGLPFSAVSAAASLKLEDLLDGLLRELPFSAVSAAASLKPHPPGPLRQHLEDVFRGIGRGLIEARPAAPASPAHARAFSAVSAAASLKRGVRKAKKIARRAFSAVSAAASLKRAALALLLFAPPVVFRGIGRGLIEAHTDRSSPGRPPAAFSAVSAAASLKQGGSRRRGAQPRNLRFPRYRPRPH